MNKTPTAEELAIKILLKGSTEYSSFDRVTFTGKQLKELAVEFARYIRSNPKEVKDYSLTIFEEGKFVSDDVKHYDNIEELFETFLKEKNEKN